MSTRKGNVIFLEEVLNKSIALAHKIIEEKNPKLKGKDAVAHAVGLGAVVFGDLSNDRIRDVAFEWERILDFEGETAPYIQYTHARACSILRKAGRGVSPKVNFSVLTHSEEARLVKSMSEFSGAVQRAANAYKPHIIARYSIDLAQAFNEFYHKCPVISDMEHVMKARLLLVDSVRQVLENGLGLLGIKSPIEM